MLWRQYVYRRGQDLHNTWDQLYARRRIRLLYISGRGFDLRAQRVMNAFVENMRESRHVVSEAKHLLVSFTGYELSQELRDHTEENAKVLSETFADLC